MMLLVLGSLLAPALAQEGVNHAPADTTVPGGPVAAGNPPLFDLDRTVAEAIRLRQTGDLRGATALLEGLGGLVPPDALGWWLYQRGICAELQWQFTEARALYEDVVARNGDHVADARFRLALVLEDLGDPDGALLQMQALARLNGFDEDDRLTLALQQGISWVNTGKVRRGTRALEEALARAPADGRQSWILAKARYTLVARQLADADHLALTGGEARVVKRLKRRIAAIQAAERAITVLVGLAEPEWIVASMRALGDSWQRLGDDLVAAPPPPRLTAAEAAIYRQSLLPYAENARTKAFHYWDAGVQLAHRLNFESPKVQALKERRDSIGR